MNYRKLKILIFITIILILLATTIFMVSKRNEIKTETDKNNTVLDPINKETVTPINELSFFKNDFISFYYPKEWEILEYNDTKNCRFLQDIEVKCLNIVNNKSDLNELITIVQKPTTGDTGGGILSESKLNKWSKLRILERNFLRSHVIDYANPEFKDLVIPVYYIFNDIQNNSTNYSFWFTVNGYDYAISYVFNGDLTTINKILTESKSILDEMDVIIQSMRF